MLATAASFKGDLQMALVRHHGLDERLRVLWAPDWLNLREREVVAKVDGSDAPGLDLYQKFLLRSKGGKAVELTMADGRVVKLPAVQVCRNMLVVSGPENFDNETYGYEFVIQPGHLFLDENITEDEALWMVVWTQGLSEEASGRIRTFNVGASLFKAAVNTAIGVGMSNAATNAAIGEAGKQALNGATQRMVAQSVAKASLPYLAAQTAATVGVSQVAKKTSRWGVNAVAATAFDEADEWAVKAMKLLGRDAGAGLKLHNRLMGQGLTGNGQRS